MGILGWLLIWVCGSALAFIVALSLCKAAADADKRML